MDGLDTGIGALGGIIIMKLLDIVRIKFSKNGSNGAALEIMRSLAAVMSEEQKTSAKVCVILEDIRDVQKDNGSKLDTLNTNLSLAMERQKQSMADIKDVKEKL